MIKQILTHYELQLAKRFSEDRVGSSVSKYRERKQSNIKKIKDDIYRGACSEIAAYNFLSEFSSFISPPDFEIYDANKKSFEADLYWNKTPMHIKSFSANSKIEPSFVFQKEDNLFKNYGDSDSIVICKTGENPKHVEILGVYRIKDIDEGCILKDPKLKRLIGIKKCIYVKDLKNINNQINKLK